MTQRENVHKLRGDFVSSGPKELAQRRRRRANQLSRESLQKEMPKHFRVKNRKAYVDVSDGKGREIRRYIPGSWSSYKECEMPLKEFANTLRKSGYAIIGHGLELPHKPQMQYQKKRALSTENVNNPPRKRMRFSGDQGYPVGAQMQPVAAAKGVRHKYPLYRDKQGELKLCPHCNMEFRPKMKKGRWKALHLHVRVCKNKSASIGRKEVNDAEKKPYSSRVKGNREAEQHEDGVMPSKKRLEQLYLESCKIEDEILKDIEEADRKAAAGETFEADGLIFKMEPCESVLINPWTGEHVKYNVCFPIGPAKGGRKGRRKSSNLKKSSTPTLTDEEILNKLCKLINPHGRGLIEKTLVVELYPQFVVNSNADLLQILKASRYVQISMSKLRKLLMTHHAENSGKLDIVFSKAAIEKEKKVKTNASHTTDIKIKKKDSHENSATRVTTQTNGNFDDDLIMKKRGHTKRSRERNDTNFFDAAEHNPKKRKKLPISLLDSPNPSMVVASPSLIGISPSLIGTSPSLNQKNNKHQPPLTPLSLTPSNGNSTQNMHSQRFRYKLYGRAVRQMRYGLPNFDDYQRGLNRNHPESLDFENAFSTDMKSDLDDFKLPPAGGSGTLVRSDSQPSSQSLSTGLNFDGADLLADDNDDSLNIIEDENIKKAPTSPDLLAAPMPEMKFEEMKLDDIKDMMDKHIKSNTSLSPPPDFLAVSPRPSDMVQKVGIVKQEPMSAIKTQSVNSNTAAESTNKEIKKEAKNDSSLLLKKENSISNSSYLLQPMSEHTSTLNDIPQFKAVSNPIPLRASSSPGHISPPRSNSSSLSTRSRTSSNEFPISSIDTNGNNANTKSSNLFALGQIPPLILPKHIKEKQGKNQIIW